MARRPAHLGPSHRRGPHPTRWPAVADTSVPNLERPQHVRARQAGLPRRHAPRSLPSSIRPPAAAVEHVGRLAEGVTRRFDPLELADYAIARRRRAYTRFRPIRPTPWSASVWRPRVRESSRTNADDCLPVASLGRVEGG